MAPLTQAYQGEVTWWFGRGEGVGLRCTTWEREGKRNNRNSDNNNNIKVNRNNKNNNNVKVITVKEKEITRLKLAISV